jgi:hypothetical protein
MASPTQTRKLILKKKKTKEGKARKRSLAAGSTPRFPVHMEDGSDALLPQPPGSSPSEK